MNKLLLFLILVFSFLSFPSFADGGCGGRTYSPLCVILVLVLMTFSSMLPILISSVFITWVILKKQIRHMLSIIMMTALCLGFAYLNGYSTMLIVMEELKLEGIYAELILFPLQFFLQSMFCLFILKIVKILNNKHI